MAKDGALGSRSDIYSDLISLHSTYYFLFEKNSDQWSVFITVIISLIQEYCVIKCAERVKGLIML